MTGRSRSSHAGCHGASGSPPRAGAVRRLCGVPGNVAGVDIPNTRYVRSGELAIAYQVFGSGDHDLVFSGGTASNVEAVWRLPEAVRLFERLGRFARVIRYDRRDTGLSDPIKDDLTLEAHAQDALAVIDAVGAQRPVLFGSLDGSRSLALLAATRPQRVGGLIALAPSVRGTAASAPEFAAEAARGITEIDSFPGAMIPLYAPRAATDPALRERLGQYIRSSVTPRQAERLLRLSLTSDISEALPLVQAPTLVLHPRDLAMVPSEAVREFADLIPGAEHREVPGNCAFVFEMDIELIAGHHRGVRDGHDAGPGHRSRSRHRAVHRSGRLDAARRAGR